MAEQEKKKKEQRFFYRIKNKFRLVIMNDETFEEKASFVLSPLNVFVFVGTLALFLIVLVSYIIAFTSLREYIPGYADVNMRKNIKTLALRVDSLDQELQNREMNISNFADILNDKKQNPKINPTAKDSTKKYEKLTLSGSFEDSMMRAEIESQSKYSLALGEESKAKSGIRNFFFFVPLKGVVTDSYKSGISHYGVDITAPENEAIKATLDGTVILATWTSETGYVIQVQHENNLVSIYKHNSVLLKKVGDKVNAGEAIAIIGNSGELTSGTHLHFELWFNGLPVDPQEYMSFN
ncbi:MAG: M23 family metallopeptidase [Bacteroidetes bacterium]|nr:M23 family metallopeptidase [Bacteroidota bacterium]